VRLNRLHLPCRVPRLCFLARCPLRWPLAALIARLHVKFRQRVGPCVELLPATLGPGHQRVALSGKLLVLSGKPRGNLLQLGRLGGEFLF
jgi:hypothetical protein